MYFHLFFLLDNQKNKPPKTNNPTPIKDEISEDNPTPKLFGLRIRIDPMAKITPAQTCSKKWN